MPFTVGGDLPRTSRLLAALPLPETVETLSLVEIEVRLFDVSSDAEEILDLGQFMHWISGQLLSADEVDSGWRKIAHPSLEVDGVQTDLNRCPGPVQPETRSVPSQTHTLKRWHVWALQSHLGVVGDGAGYWIADNDDEPDLRQNLEDARWN